MDELAVAGQCLHGSLLVRGPAIPAAVERREPGDADRGQPIDQLPGIDVVVAVDDVVAAPVESVLVGEGLQLGVAEAGEPAGRDRACAGDVASPRFPAQPPAVERGQRAGIDDAEVGLVESLQQFGGSMVVIGAVVSVVCGMS